MKFTTVFDLSSLLRRTSRPRKPMTFDEMRYRAKLEKLAQTKKESARAYLLRKHQEEQEKESQKGFGDKEYEKRMEFFRRIDKARQRDA